MTLEYGLFGRGVLVAPLFLADAPGRRRLETSAECVAQLFRYDSSRARELHFGLGQD